LGFSDRRLKSGMETSPFMWDSCRSMTEAAILIAKLTKDEQIRYLPVAYGFTQNSEVL